MSPPRATVSILAVGTEVVEGQILDRNSAWLARECSRMGFAVVGHRCVPDDRAMIRRAIDELRRESSIVFVSGGLGPTSDDFTRELIAEAFEARLEFHEDAWREVKAKLAARGIESRESQKRQCWFPGGAQVLPNPVGTANGFRLQSGESRLFALPGPPSEVTAVFESSVRQELEGEVPPDQRLELRIWRCLGRGESEIAEIAEAALQGAGMTIGYRAHMPYVEVKVWVPRATRAAKQPWLDALETGLAPWLVNHDDEDVIDALLDALAGGGGGARDEIVDAATGGLLATRICERLHVRRPTPLHEFMLDVRTVWPSDRIESLEGQPSGAGARILLGLSTDGWTVVVDRGGQERARVEVRPPYSYRLESERARRFICEKAGRIAGLALQ